MQCVETTQNKQVFGNSCNTTSLHLFDYTKYLSDTVTYKFYLTELYFLFEGLVEVEFPELNFECSGFFYKIQNLIIILPLINILLERLQITL